MSRSQISFSKREKEKKRLKKRKDKEKKKEERKANSQGGGLDNMIAFVDEYGVITDTPPDPTEKKDKVKAENIEVSVPKKEKEDPDRLLSGIVDYFNPAKGFGFILDSDSREKYFFHINGTLEEVDAGDKVEFRLENGLKGINAVDVKRKSKH
jgi:cold shock CspA family protein